MRGNDIIFLVSLSTLHPEMVMLPRLLDISTELTHTETIICYCKASAYIR